ncbi:MAG: hypothetical protein O7F08_13705 [Deltaproteobacteria bacterium]|nr:hypothetical protein [Deltaproteobacteria bacterium]
MPAGQGAGLLGSFSGFFAHGGNIPSGKFGIVGERGPELVSGPAKVTPAASMVGGDTVFELRLITPDGRAITEAVRYRLERGKHLREVAQVPITING